LSNVVLASLEPLFHSPVVRLLLGDAQGLNERLLKEVEARRAASPGVRRSNQRGWHSEEDFFLRSEPACAELRARIVEAIALATARIAPTFDPATKQLQCEGWINVNGPGAFNTPHDHPGWAWSGTYYVKVPAQASGTSGCIEFLDVRTNVRAITIEGANCFASKVTFRPEEGQLLLFPAYLRHWVYPNEQDEERVSVAFNARYALAKRP
jgi:uncharacterized protein (TIGR02466 family)